MSRRIYCLFGGKIQGTPWEPLYDLYRKRLVHWSLDIQEITQWKEDKLKIFFQQKILITLCERGKMMNSQEFCSFILRESQGNQHLCFAIGNFDGYPTFMSSYAQHSLCFGPMTYTHLTTRLLLLEQLYRAQQKILNHPYTKV